MLAAAGVASRRASEELVFAGEVSVNGATVLQPQTPVDPQRDEVRAHGGDLHFCTFDGHLQTSRPQQRQALGA